MTPAAQVVSPPRPRIKEKFMPLQNRSPVRQIAYLMLTLAALLALLAVFAHWGY